MDTDTQRDIELQSGSGPVSEPADHAVVDIAPPREIAVTQRGKNLATAYFGDLQQARGVALAPPSLKELVRRLWHQPEVLADSALLVVLNRLYAIVVLPLVAVLYFLISAQLHPARALVVDTALGLFVWMVFFS